MHAKPTRNGLTFWTTCAVTAGAVALLSAFGPAEPEPAQPSASAAPVANRYIGAKKCKSCHSSEEAGDQYGAWEAAAHAKALDTLASDEAKRIASEKGIEDPQTADQCVKCHSTAFGVDEGEIKRGFKDDMGVQCEKCHGPGEEHMKARFEAAASEDPNAGVEPGEIVSQPSKEVCVQCHNPESPTHQEFCFHASSRKISHLRPERAKEVAALGLNDCSSCHSSGADLIEPRPAFCTTCHDPVPDAQ